MSEKLRLVQSLLLQAVEIEEPQARAEFLAQACGTDVELRNEVEALIAADSGAKLFMPDKPSDEAKQYVQDAVHAAQAQVKAASLPGLETLGQRIGPYRVLEAIGEGGCGVVYLAEQEAPIRRAVALKLIKLGMDTRSVVARFEAERQALALMDHPNIAKVFDAGATQTGRPFFVMELVRGIKITKYCDGHQLRVSRRLKLFIQVCQAVQHAHQRGIIHRDFKPSNILVTDVDGNAEPKIIDFGIARATGGLRLTDTTVSTGFEQFLGTPIYMSPEQAAGKVVDVDTLTDIYSLGVLLYELLTGKTPFEVQTASPASLEAIRRTIQEKQPTRPSARLNTIASEELKSIAQMRGMEAGRLNSLVAGDLDWIVMKCLQKEPSRRYASASELARDLERHLANEAVSARSPSRGYLLKKMAQRHKVGIASLMGVGLALVGGLMLSTWEAARARRAERREKGMRETAQMAQAEEARQRQRAEAGELFAHNSYAACLMQVQQAWDQDEGGLVRELLAEMDSFPDHDFEWYYWQRQVHPEIMRLHGHTDIVRSAAFSPDGRRIVTGSQDRTAQVWDATTGAIVLTIDAGIEQIWSVAFSPDGLRIATGHEGRTAKVWDAVTGRHLLTLEGHNNRIASIAYSGDGLRIATGSLDGTSRIWDAVTGQQLITLQGHSGEVRSVAFSPDGHFVVTGSDDRMARVWDAATGSGLFALVGHRANVISVAYSPDGRRIATGSDDTTAKIWDAATGAELLTIPVRAQVKSVRFSPDGTRIVTGNRDKLACVWDVATGQRLLAMNADSDTVWSAAFSPDGRRVVTAGSDGTAKVWDVSTERFFRPPALNAVNPFVAAPASDGRRIMTAGTSLRVNVGEFSPGGEDFVARVWDTVTGKQLLMLSGHSARIRSAAFSPDDSRVITGSEDGCAKVWDTTNGTELLTLKGQSGPITSIACSPDGRRIVAGTEDGSIAVWDAIHGGELFLLKRHTGRIHSVSFSADSKRVVTSSADRTAIIWDVIAGRQLSILRGHSDEVCSAVFSKDGRNVATVSFDNTARVWSATNGAETLKLSGVTNRSRFVAFSPKGRRILTGGENQTASLWDVASGRHLLLFRGDPGRTLSLTVSSDGRRVVMIGSGRSLANMWQAATEEETDHWRAEDKTGRDYLATVRQERAAQAARAEARLAQDPGAIKQWLVLAPISAKGAFGPAALAQEQISNESALQPVSGGHSKVSVGELVWKPVQLQDCLLDFNQLLGTTALNSVAYAVCYVHSKSAQKSLLMKIGSDDEAKVYLNLKQIYVYDQISHVIPDQDVVPH